MKKLLLFPLCLFFVFVSTKDYKQKQAITNSSKSTYTDENQLYSSDIRWKTNVQNLEASFEKISKLRGVTFEYKIKEFPEKNFDKGIQIGFIAQEIEQVIPEIVKTDNNGYKSVDYAKITPFLVETMKEQQKQIENQKFIIEKLQKENQQLKSEFSKLKTSVDKFLMEKSSQMKTPDKAKDSDTKKQ